MQRRETEEIEETVTILRSVRRIVRDLDDHPATPCGAVTTCGTHPAHDATDEPSGIHRRLDGPCTALAKCGPTHLALVTTGGKRVA